MSEKISLGEALEMLCEVFEENDDSLKLETSLSEVFGWDSLGQLALMAEYDERFDIVLTSNQLESFKTVNDIIDVLKFHGTLL